MKQQLVRSVLCVFIAWWLTPTIATGHAKTTVQQQPAVSGRVTDKQTGEPLMGATILVKSTGLTTVTAEGGLFSAIAGEGDTLLISFVSYEKVKVPVMGRQRIEVTLQATADAL